jgi:hypothetical protein
MELMIIAQMLTIIFLTWSKHLKLKDYIALNGQMHVLTFL